jgi:hypothetical protein
MSRSKFVGDFNPDGSIRSYPEVDIRGGEYSRPASTQSIGRDADNNKLFVVLPVGVSPAQAAPEIAALKERLGIPQREVENGTAPATAPKTGDSANDRAADGKAEKKTDKG